MPDLDLATRMAETIYKLQPQQIELLRPLIDWDCAGLGLPILDVGYLLLTSHYDLARPLRLAADADKIRAILHGYQQARPITAPERALMKSAVQFALAVHLGEYLAEHPQAESSDSVIAKVQARFAATAQIAQIAVGDLEAGRS